ncbi:MAG: UDP glycosyltransferase [Deltaproteobacteria bacterium]|nr:UDP glycosyltransferase [Deltaproteobacteria bacterium]
MKILALPYSHTLSHLSRPLLLAKELRKRGYEVVFGAESPKVVFIRDEGFDVLPIYEPEPDILFGNIRAGKIRFVSDAELDRMIEADISLYKMVQPGLVLTDGRFTAPISTHMAGLRHVAVVNVSSTEYRALPYVPFFEWIPTRFVGRETRLWGSLSALNLKIEMKVFDGVMKTFTELSRKYALSKPVTATNCLAGKDLTLLADVPEYFPARNLPVDYHYIGPLTWESKAPPPPWWPPKTGSNPLIYLTMGTTGIRDFFELTCELVQRSNVTAIITTGAQVDQIDAIDGKIYVEPFMNGDLVMEECDLVVCHGGNGTIYQALSHGKPIVGIPTIPDQKFNMRRVEALGVGHTLSWKSFFANPAVLLDAIQSLLANPAFAANACRMQSILKNFQGAKAGADIIENFVVDSFRPS